MFYYSQTTLSSAVNILVVLSYILYDKNKPYGEGYDTLTPPVSTPLHSNTNPTMGANERVRHIHSLSGKIILTYNFRNVHREMANLYKDSVVIQDININYMFYYIQNNIRCGMS